MLFRSGRDASLALPNYGVREGLRVLLLHVRRPLQTDVEDSPGSFSVVRHALVRERVDCVGGISLDMRSDPSQR